jgi:NodT family efflux transporter outer membrane factor (OMF) lipoprotein
VIGKLPLLAACLFTAGACAVGPRYRQPPAPTPPAYKEAADWKPSHPRDEMVRGAWWEIFHDEQLNAMEERVSVSNQTLKAARAQFDQARALVGSSRAGLFPQLAGTMSTTEVNQSANRPLWNPSADTQYADYVLRVDASYELDVWGRVARTVEASRAQAQASAADLEAVGLSLHAELALDYFQLRELDAEQQILETTLTAYQKALELTRNRHDAGLVSGSDVALAETQLETTRAQLIELGVRRAQVEHAMAALTGQPASSFSVPALPLSMPTPEIPAGLPAEVLERRPDVAAAERRVAAANAQVGLARSAFYPVLALTGSTGFESAALRDWIRAASNLWSAAPTAALALLDGGRRRAVTQQAQAGYDRAVAQYQDTVLTAFREVEDNLAALRILAEEARVQNAATAAADRSLALATNRYKAGAAAYLEVISAQNALLANQRVGVGILMRRLNASVLLIKALGGGWDTSKLPRV